MRPEPDWLLRTTATPSAVANAPVPHARGHYARPVETLLGFGAALLALRLAGRVLGRWRSRRAPELLAWGASLVAYAAASAALAWGAAAGWDARAFRVYYLFGGLLTAPLLGAGSLLLWDAVGRRRSRSSTPASRPASRSRCRCTVASATGSRRRRITWNFVPARLVAIFGNSLGTLAVILVAAATFRRRPVGNTLIVAGVAVAAVGSALAGLGEAQTAAFAAVAVILLSAGFVSRR